ncbi:FUSC family protein [Thermosporothrix hazakensis]|uniref:FUSC family protein n=1 Tax=Thermosporothrix hazakensis TaxID=644383 RepID=UPI001B87B3FB|nr:FUSC family protein [Thermosporothrix hazakensis]
MKKRLISLLQRLKNYLFDIQKQDLTYGIRLTIICIVPIVAGMLLKNPLMMSSGFLGGLYVALADVGGAYSTRALSMLLATLSISIVGVLGTISGGSIWLAVPLAFLFMFLLNMFSIYGNIGAKVSMMTSGAFLIFLGQPHGPAIALQQGIALLCGGVWAMIVSLWLWPLRPYKPVRMATSAYYRSLALFLLKAGRSASYTSGRWWNDAAKNERALVLEAYKRAHNTVMTLRASRNGSNVTLQQLFMLTLDADRLFDATIALAEGIQGAKHHIHNYALWPTMKRLLQQTATMCTFLAKSITQNKLDMTKWEGLHNAQETSLQELREKLPGLTGDTQALASVQRVLRIFRQICTIGEEAMYTLAQLDDERLEALTTPVLKKRTGPREAWTLFRDNLSFQSLTFRHALRVSVATTVAVVIYSLLKLDHGYWLTLTVMLSLKPEFASTRTRVFERVIGTVLGGMLGAWVAYAIRDRLLLFALLVVFCLLAYSRLRRNYSAFVIFLTPFMVVLTDLGHPGDWGIAMLRMMNTLMGGVIAMIACYLFWPQWERERLPQYIAEALAANRSFLHCVLDIYAGKHEKRADLHQASAQAHLRNINAAAAFQRLLNEPRKQQGSVERFYALVAYNQRLCDSITFLAAHLPDPKSPAIPGVEAFKQHTDEVLTQVERAVTLGERPEQLSPLEESLQEIRATLYKLTATTPQERKPEMHILHARAHHLIKHAVHQRH